jgi:hypothetical protein
MLPLASVLLITALSVPASVLVLRDGLRFNVDGAIHVENGRATFRVGGTLYSVPAGDVDLEATRVVGAEVQQPAKVPERNRLRVNESQRDRLLRELEQNHEGKPAPAEALRIPPGPTAAERAQSSEDEWTWRGRARGYEEGIRRAQEDLNLLMQRVARLQAQISGFLSLGFKPNQFSYQTTQLAYLQEQIPDAELQVQRAQRLYAQFRDDARRQGVTPGWLR